MVDLELEQEPELELELEQALAPELELVEQAREQGQELVELVPAEPVGAEKRKLENMFSDIFFS